MSTSIEMRNGQEYTASEDAATLLARRNAAWETWMLSSFDGYMQINDGGDIIEANEILYIGDLCMDAYPTVTGLDPDTGTSAGGTSVAITGTALTGVSSVKFGGAAATDFTVNSDRSITATSPAGTADSLVVVVVHGPRGPSSTLGQGITYRYPPT
jgi:hypothetical protein